MTEVTSVSSDKGAAAANLTQVTEVEVKLGDKTVKVDSAVAAELAAARKAADEAGVKVGSLTSQMAELNTKLEAALKPAQKAALEKTGETPLDVLLFTDPSQAIAMIEKNILEKVNQTNQVENSRKEFWSEFYSQNKELNDFKGYVDFVFNRELPGLVKKNLTVGDTIKEVSKIVKTELLKIKGVPENKQKLTAEGGSESGNSGKQTESEKQEGEGSQTTTASILLERREARRQARTTVGRKAGK